MPLWSCIVAGDTKDEYTSRLLRPEGAPVLSTTSTAGQRKCYTGCHLAPCAPTAGRGNNTDAFVTASEARAARRDGDGRAETRARIRTGKRGARAPLAPCASTEPPRPRADRGHRHSSHYRCALRQRMRSLCACVSRTQICISYLSCIADKPEYQVLVLPGNPGNAGEERQCSGPALLQPRTALRPQPRLSCPSARRLLPQVHEHASHIIERQGPRHLLQPRGSRPSSHREKGKTHAHTYNIRTYTAFHSACL